MLHPGLAGNQAGAPACHSGPCAPLSYVDPAEAVSSVKACFCLPQSPDYVSYFTGWWRSRRAASGVHPLEVAAGMYVLNIFARVLVLVPVDVTGRHLGVAHRGRCLGWWAC